MVYPCDYLDITAGLDVLCGHTNKTICHETERAKTDLNIQMKSS